MTNEKTEVQAFIEDAIAGGYAEGRADFIRRLPQYALCQIFLDPLAWQAVGKTRGKDQKYAYVTQEWWHQQWHRFIDHLADGKTVEEALAAIQ